MIYNKFKKEFEKNKNVDLLSEAFEYEQLGK